VWETWSEGIPDIGRSEHNIVVREAKIHNDASVDISSDGRLLVTLVPSNLPMTTLVGLYSLEKDTRGQVLATYRSVVLMFFVLILHQCCGSGFAWISIHLARNENLDAVAWKLAKIY
jgi:hypothetical protein